MPKDKEMFLGATFLGIAQGLSKGFEIAERRKAGELAQKKFQMDQLKMGMDIKKFERDEIEHVWNYGGKDPVTGEEIPKEKSMQFLKQKALEQDNEIRNIKLQEEKLKLRNMYMDTQQQHLPKLPAPIENIVV